MHCLKFKIMKSLLKVIFLLSALSFAQPSDLGYQLNGSNDYLVTPNTSYINTSSVSNRTVETWFKTNDASNKQVIYEEGGGVNAILIYLDSDQLYCGAYKGSGSNARFFKSESGVIKDDTWYHVAFVISTTGGSANFSWYLNGELQDILSGFTIPAHSGDIQIGRNGNLRYANCSSWSASYVNGSNSKNCFSASGNSGTPYYFNGNVWGFRIWNSGRTVDELNSNMNVELSTGTNLVAYLDNDSVNYINNSNNWSMVVASGNGTTYTWSQTAISANWNHPGNWQGSTVPVVTNLRKVIIPKSDVYPTISSELRIGKLELTSNESEIVIEDGGTLNVFYDVNNGGTIRVKNNGSFILQDNKPVSGEGTFIIERDTPDYPADYYSIWSTPVTEADSEIGTIFTNNFIGYKFDASQNPSAYVQVGGSNSMEIGRGYFIRSDNDSGIIKRTFTGTVNNGDIEEPIYHNSETDNFNLIGNPYSSALDWTLFYKDNSEMLAGTAYFWSQNYSGTTNSAADYISFNATGTSDSGVTGKIGTGQGFFVKSLQSGAVNFKNTQRIVQNNNQFLKSTTNTDDNKSWFRLTGTMGYSPILVGFVPGATDGYESEYDAEFMNEGASIEFYSLIEDGKYDVQGRSELQPYQSVQVPLGFQVTTGGDYTISKVLEYIDPAFEILLEDTLENTMTDLKALDYTFNVSGATEDNARFILHYIYSETLSSKDFIEDSDNLSSFFSGNQLITNIKNDELPIVIQLFDISGKEILNSSFSKTIQTQKLSSGLYIVKYSFQKSTVITKKIFKS